VSLSIFLIHRYRSESCGPLKFKGSVVILKGLKFKYSNIHTWFRQPCEWCRDLATGTTDIQSERQPSARGSENRRSAFICRLVCPWWCQISGAAKNSACFSQFGQYDLLPQLEGARWIFFIRQSHFGRLIRSISYVADPPSCKQTKNRRLENYISWRVPILPPSLSHILSD
jgi:hypothetical protein